MLEFCPVLKKFDEVTVDDRPSDDDENISSPALPLSNLARISFPLYASVNRDGKEGFNVSHCISVTLVTDWGQGLQAVAGV